MWPVSVAIVVLLLVFSVYLTVRRYRLLSLTTRAVARIVKIETNANEFNEVVYYPVMEFDFDRQTYVVKSKVGYQTAPYQCGDNVVVWFDPDTPERAQLSRFRKATSEC